MGSKLELFVTLLPLIAISVPFAIGFYHVAKKIGRNKTAWTILSLIPIVNYFSWIYFFFVILIWIFDKLNGIEERVAEVRS